MKSAVIAFLTCLLVLYVQGQSSDNVRTCRCLNDFVGRINTKLIKGLPVIYQPSVFCPQREIIITTTANKLKCVDPESPLGKILMKNMKKKENEVVSMTPTTSQTQNSTSHHSTSTTK